MPRFWGAMVVFSIWITLTESAGPQGGGERRAAHATNRSQLGPGREVTGDGREMAHRFWREILPGTERKALAALASARGAFSAASCAALAAAAEGYVTATEICTEPAAALTATASVATPSCDAMDAPIEVSTCGHAQRVHAEYEGAQVLEEGALAWVMGERKALAPRP